MSKKLYDRTTLNRIKKVPVSTVSTIKSSIGGNTTSSKVNLANASSTPIDQTLIKEWKKYLPQYDKSNLYNINVDEFKDYMPGGNVYAYDPTTLMQMRAENQTNWEKFKRSSLNPLNLIPNIALGVLEGIGYTAELPDLVTGGDFENSLTRWTKRNRNLYSGDDEIYYDPTDERVFKLDDAGWWFETGGDLVESIGEFAVIGGGLTKGVGAVTKGIASTIKGIKYANTLNKVIRGIGKVATAAELSYIEGAMSGATVYQQVYQDALSKGLSSFEAKKLASKSAATTVRINTAIITPLNLTSIGAMFGETDDFIRIANRNIKRTLTGKAEKEALESIDNLIANQTKKFSPFARNNIKKTGLVLGLEAGEEGIEEVLNLVAEYGGKRQGGIDSANKYASWLKGAVEVAFSQEGLLNFILGAVGGIGQTIATQDMMKVGLKDDGTFGIKRSINYEKNKAIYNETLLRATHLKEDYLSVIDAKTDLVNSMNSDGTIDEVKRDKALDDLFAVSLRSIPDGTAENLIASFQEIANVSNTQNGLAEDIKNGIDLRNELISERKDEPIRVQSYMQQVEKLQTKLRAEEGRSEAVRLGLSKGYNEDGTLDNSYVTKANERISEIKMFQKQYDEAFKNFKFADDEELAGLPDALFSNHVLLHYTKKALDSSKTSLAQLESNEFLKVLPNYENILSEAKNNITRYENKVKKQEEAIESLKSSKGRQEFVNNFKKLSKNLEEYITEQKVNEVKEKVSKAEKDIDAILQATEETVDRDTNFDEVDEFTKKSEKYKRQIEILDDKLKEVDIELSKTKDQDKIDSLTANKNIFEKRLKAIKQKLAVNENQNKGQVNTTLLPFLKEAGYVKDSNEIRQGWKVKDEGEQRTEQEWLKYLYTKKGREEIYKWYKEQRVNRIKEGVESKVNETKPNEPITPSSILNSILNEINSEVIPLIDTIAKKDSSGKFVFVNPSGKEFALLNPIDGTVSMVKVKSYSSLKENNNILVELTEDTEHPNRVIVGGKKNYVALFGNGIISIVNANGYEQLGYKLNEIHKAISEINHTSSLTQDAFYQNRMFNGTNVFAPDLGAKLTELNNGDIQVEGNYNKTVFDYIVNQLQEGDMVTVSYATKEDIEQSDNIFLKERYEQHKDDIENAPVRVTVTKRGGKKLDIAFLNQLNYLKREIALSNVFINPTDIDLVTKLFAKVMEADLNKIEEEFTKEVMNEFDKILKSIPLDNEGAKFMDSNKPESLKRDVKHLKRLFEFKNGEEKYEDAIISIMSWSNKMQRDFAVNKQFRDQLTDAKKRGVKDPVITSVINKKTSGEVIFIKNEDNYKTVYNSFGTSYVREMKIGLAKEENVMPIDIESGEKLEDFGIKQKFVPGMFYVLVPNTKMYIPLLSNKISDKDSKTIVDAIMELHKLSEIEDEDNSNWRKQTEKIKNLLYTLSIKAKTSKKEAGTLTKKDEQQFMIHNDRISFGNLNIYFKNKTGWNKYPVMVIGDETKIDMGITAKNTKIELKSDKEVSYLQGIISNNLRYNLTAEALNKDNKEFTLKNKVKIAVGKLVTETGKRIANIRPTGTYNLMFNVGNNSINPNENPIDNTGVELLKKTDELFKDTGKKSITLENNEEILNIANLQGEDYLEITKALNELGVKITLLNERGKDSPRPEEAGSIAVYNSKDNSIKLRVKEFAYHFTRLSLFNKSRDIRFNAEKYFQRTVLHEMLHPILRNAIIEDTSGTLKERLDSFRNDFLIALESSEYNNLWNKYFENNDILNEIKKNSQEMVTYAMTDPRIANILNEINTTNELNGKKETFWEKLRGLFLDFLRFFGITIRKGSMLEELDNILRSYQNIEGSIVNNSINEDDEFFAIGEVSPVKENINIQYNNQNEILAPNGNVSKLYKDIEKLVEEQNGDKLISYFDKNIGKDTILNTKEQALQLYKQTRSKEFKEWFGDSKVVDENGEPLIVYHFSPDKITKFDKNKTTDNVFYFTDDSTGHNIYYPNNYNDKSNISIPVFLNIDKPLFAIDQALFKTEEDYTTYLEYNKANNEYLSKLDKNRLRLLKKEITKEEYEIEKKKIYNSFDYTSYNYNTYKLTTRVSSELLSELNKKYNGIIKYKPLSSLGNYSNETFYIVFEPNQIKSVFNQGTFSKETNNIYKAISEFQVNKNINNNNYINVTSLTESVRGLYQMANRVFAETTLEDLTKIRIDKENDTIKIRRLSIKQRVIDNIISMMESGTFSTTQQQLWNYVIDDISKENSDIWEKVIKRTSKLNAVNIKDVRRFYNEIELENSSSKKDKENADITEDDIEKEVYDEMEESITFQSKLFNDIKEQTRSTRLNIPAEVKARFNTYPKIEGINVDGTYKYVTNKITGLQEYMDFTEVYPTISDLLANSYDIDDMISKVKERTLSDVSLITFLEDLQNENIDFAPQVYNTMGVAKLKSLYLKYNPIEETTEIDDARKSNNPIYKLSNQWKNILISEIDELYKKVTDKEEYSNDEIVGKLLSAEEKLKQLKDEFTELNKCTSKNTYTKEVAERIANNLHSKLDSIGINIPTNYFIKELERNNYNNKVANNYSNNIKYITDWTVKTINNVLKDKIKIDDIKNSKFFDEVSNFNDLAEIVRFYSYDAVELNNTNVEGNSIYVLQKPFYLSDMFTMFHRAVNKNGSNKALNDLTKWIKEIASIPKYQYSNWLWSDKIKLEDGLIRNLNNGFINYKIENGIKVFDSLNEEFLNSFQLSALDGNKNVITREGKTYENMSDKDWLLLQLSMHIDGLDTQKSKVNKVSHISSSFVIGSDAGNIHNFTIAKTFADKDGGRGITSKEQDAISKQKKEDFIKVADELIDINGNNINLFQQVYNTLIQEVVHMKDNFELLFEYDDKGEVVEKELPIEIYNKLQKFKHWKGNRELLKNGVPIGDVFQFNNMLIRDTNKTFRNYLKGTTYSDYYGQYIVNNELKQLAKEFTLDFIWSQSRLGISLLSEFESIFISGKKKLFNHISTNFDAVISEFMLTQYINIIEQQNFFVGNNYEYKDYNDTNKRAKQLLAPGTPYDDKAIGKDTYNIAVMKSIKLPSSDINKIKENIREGLRQRKGLKEEDIERLVKVISKPYESIDTTDGQSIITLDEAINRTKGLGRYKKYKRLLDKLIGIRDGKIEVTSGDIRLLLSPFKNYYYDRGYDNILKDVVSEQVKNSEMILTPQIIKGTIWEKINKFMIDNKIGQLDFDTAIKVGISNSANVTEKNIENNLEDLLSTVKERKYKNLRLQLDVPEHHKDTENLFGSQIRRLILGNISPDMKFQVGTEELDGTQLNDTYMELLSTNIMEDAKAILKELGVQGDSFENYLRDDYGNIIISDDKLSDLLLKEVERRNLADNYKTALQTNLEIGTFNLPLYMNGLIDKYQALLTSIFTNGVTKQKLPGSHNVQFTNTFLNFKDIEKHTLDEYGEKGIIFRKDFIERVKERGSNKLGIYNKDGKIVIECIMPPFSKQFYENNKLIDINNIDSDVLRMIGYRIPTSAKNMTFVLDVVGFMDESTGSVTILPDEIITKTGSDFDIDTIYFIRKHFIRNEENKFESIKYDNSKSIIENTRKQRDNKLLDIIESVLINDYFKTEVLTPGNYEYSLEAAKIIREMDGEETGKGIYANDFIGQVMFRSTNMSGKVLKGRAANANSFNSVAQVMKLKYDNGGFKFRYKLSDIPYSVNKLKEMYGNENVIEDNDIVEVLHDKIAFNNNDTFTNILGIPTIEHVAEVLSHILDIVKFPLAKNINNYTFSPYITGISLGIPIMEMTLFSSQQGIRDLYSVWNDNNSIISDEKSGLEETLVTKQYQTELYLSYIGIDMKYVKKWTDEYNRMVEINNEERVKRPNNDLANELFEKEFKNIDKSRLKKYQLKEQFRSIVKTGTVNIYNKSMKKEGEFKTTTTNIWNDILKYEPGEVYSFTKEELISMLENSKKVSKLDIKDKINYYRNQLRVIESFKKYKTLANEYVNGISIAAADKMGASPDFSITYEWLDKVFSQSGYKIINKCEITENKVVIQEYDDGTALVYTERNKPQLVSEINNKSMSEALLPKLIYKGKPVFPSSVNDKSIYEPIQTTALYSNMLSLDIGKRYFITEHEIVKEFKNRIAKTQGIQLDTKLNKQINSYLLGYLLRLYKNDLFDIDDTLAKEILGLTKISSIYYDGDDFAKYSVMSVANKVRYFKERLKDRVANVNHIVNYLHPKTTLGDMDRYRFQNILFDNTRGDVLKDDAIKEFIYEMYSSGDKFDIDLIRDLIRFQVVANGYSFGLNSITKLIPNEILIQEGVGEYYNKLDINNIPFENLLDGFIRSHANNTMIVPKVYNSKKEYGRERSEDGITTLLYKPVNGLPDWQNSPVVEEYEEFAKGTFMIKAKELFKYNNESDLYKRIAFATYVNYNNQLYKRYKKDEELFYFEPVNSLSNRVMEFGEESILPETLEQLSVQSISVNIKNGEKGIKFTTTEYGNQVMDLIKNGVKTGITFDAVRVDFKAKVEDIVKLFSEKGNIFVKVLSLPQNIKEMEEIDWINNEGYDKRTLENYKAAKGLYRQFTFEVVERYINLADTVGREIRPIIKTDEQTPEWFTQYFGTIVEVGKKDGIVSNQLEHIIPAAIISNSDDNTNVSLVRYLWSEFLVDSKWKIGMISNTGNDKFVSSYNSNSKEILLNEDVIKRMSAFEFEFKYILSILNTIAIDTNKKIKGMSASQLQRLINDTSSEKSNRYELLNALSEYGKAGLEQDFAKQSEIIEKQRKTC